MHLEQGRSYRRICRINYTGPPKCVRKSLYLHIRASKKIFIRGPDKARYAADLEIVLRMLYHITIRNNATSARLLNKVTINYVNRRNKMRMRQLTESKSELF